MANGTDIWDTELGRRVTKHHKDLYEGNGKPSLTTRMEVVENRTDDIKTTLSQHDKKLDRLFWLVAIGVGILIALQFLAPIIKDTVKASVGISQNLTEARSQLSTMQ